MNIRNFVASLGLVIGLNLSGCGGGGSGGSSGAPTISSQPQSIGVTGAQSASFSVSAGGDAPLNYQWYRNGIPLSQATSATYTIGTPALGDDGAQFNVVVSNAIGSASSVATTLRVSVASGVNLLAGGLGGPGSSDGFGTAARFAQSSRGGGSIAVNSAGEIFIADGGNHVIRKVSLAGEVSTIAGEPGQLGHVDGTGRSARFYRPVSLAFDAGENLYVAEEANTIRRISKQGVVTTLAGSHLEYGSTDGVGGQARFGILSAISIDESGNLYAVSDQSTVRKITPTGEVSTLAGSALQPGTNDGIGAAARFGQLNTSIAVDADNNIYVTELVLSTNPGTVSIRKITPAGLVTTFVSGASPGLHVVSDSGELRIVQQDPFSVRITVKQVDRLGAITTITDGARVQGFIFNVGLDKSGNVLLRHAEGTMLSRLSTDGRITFLAGSEPQRGFTNSSGGLARFNLPVGVATDTSGNTYVADGGNSAIRKITPAGVVTTLAGGSRGIADGTGAAASFLIMGGIASDLNGNIFVIDGEAGIARGYVRKVSSSGVVTTIADPSKFGVPAGQGFFFTGIGVDSSGNAMVCAVGLGVFSISPSGAVSPISSQPCWSIAGDRFGDVYVSQRNTVGKLNSDGSFTLLAGMQDQPGYQDGTGPNALFTSSGAIAVDQIGNVYMVDGLTIRKITPTGTVTTVAGIANRAGVVGGAPGGLNGPVGIAAAPSGSGVTLIVSNAMEHNLVAISLP